MYTDYFARTGACFVFGHIALSSGDTVIPIVFSGLLGLFWLAAGVVNAALWIRSVVRNTSGSPYMGGE